MELPAGVSVPCVGSSLIPKAIVAIQTAGYFSLKHMRGPLMSAGSLEYVLKNQVTGKTFSFFTGLCKLCRVLKMCIFSIAFIFG